MPNRQQAIVWADDERVPWYFYTLLDLDDLINFVCDVIFVNAHIATAEDPLTI